MTPEAPPGKILRLVYGSEEAEDVHALEIPLQSIKTLDEKGLGARNNRPHIIFVGTRST
jgi:hypothetical protein